jgi:hypothetical protein
VYDYRDSFDHDLNKLSEEYAYFTDAYPEGDFKLSAFGFFPVNLDKVLEKLTRNLEKFLTEE